MDRVRLSGSDAILLGHVVAPGGAMPDVVVTVNGQGQRLASPSEPVDVENPPLDGRIWWSASFLGSELPAGELVFEATAVDRTGIAERLEPFIVPELVRDHPQRIIGYLDTPMEGEVVNGGVVEVAGWATNSADIDAIEILVDGSLAMKAIPFCHVRRDLVERSGTAANVFCGFWDLVDLEERPEGSTCSLSIHAVGRSGRTNLATRTITVGPLLRPVTDDLETWISALSARTALSTTRARGERRTEQSLNLLVVTHDLGLGGAQLWLDQIVMRLLSDWDVSCTIMASGDGELRRDLEDAGAQVHLLGEVPGQAGLYESKVRDMVDRIAGEDVGIVFANTVNAFIGVDVALRCGVPSVYAIHEHYPRHVLLRNLFGTYGADEYVASRYNLALHEATAVGFVSDATHKLFLSDDTDDRALTIAYGITLDEVDAARRKLDRDQLREEHGFPPAAKVLVCLAALGPRKCPANLVAAFARIAAATGDAHLALVGGLGDPYAAGLLTLIRALGLEYRARVVPLTTDVAPWWIMADGFVLPSDAESLPRSILEAMAYEVPILATDVGGVSEVVRDGVTGFLVAPNDIDDLTLGLRRLLGSDPGDLRAMTKTAAQEVRATRESTAYVDTYLRLLRGLAQDPLAPPQSLVGPL